MFRWCTDYRAKDGAITGEGYARRVLSRSPTQVVYEDLWWEKDGWRWRRYRVRLTPPDRWHAESTANYRDMTIDYRLVDLPDRRTRLDLRIRRRPTALYPHQPTKSEMTADLTRAWDRYARQLERDYRASRRRPRP